MNIILALALVVLQSGGPAAPKNPEAAPRKVVGVKVTFPDGRPAPQARVFFTMHAANGRTSNPWAECNSEGVCGREATAGTYCVVAATNGHFASEMTAIVTTAERGDELTLMLKPAARVYGEVTFGKEKRPVIDAYVVLIQSDDGKHPGPKVGRQRITQDITRYGRADAQGHFEFYVAPGHYSLLAGSAPSFSGSERRTEFDIKDQTDIEVNIHQDRISRMPFIGRLFLKSDAKQKVPPTVIRGASIEPRIAAYVHATSNADGELQGTRTPCETLIEVHTTDNKFAGIAHISADDPTVDITLEPAATVHGRLIDESTGQPLPGRSIRYELQFNGQNRILESPQGKGVHTNVDGEFTLAGLTPGWRYVFRMDEITGRRLPSFRPADFMPQSAGVMELGEIRVQLPLDHKVSHP
jgi:hypothetical protein